MTTDCLSSKSEQGRHESAQFSTQGRGTTTLTEYFNRTMGEETKFVSSTSYGSGYMCLAKAMLVASVRPNRGGRQPGEVSCVLQLAVVCLLFTSMLCSCLSLISISQIKGHILINGPFCKLMDKKE